MRTRFTCGKPWRNHLPGTGLADRWPKSGDVRCPDFPV